MTPQQLRFDRTKERERDIWFATQHKVSLALSYLCSTALTSAVMLGLYVSSLIGLHQAGYLPPPPFVNSLCADEKLEALRQRPPKQPTDLIVGSSVAEYNIDSAKIVIGTPQARPLNEGFCAAQAHQVAFV